MPRPLTVREKTGAARRPRPCNEYTTHHKISFAGGATTLLQLKAHLEAKIGATAKATRVPDRSRTASMMEFTSVRQSQELDY
jgi:hypothetical protein